MMARSSRFLSLSGLSGVAAGIWALAGAWVANRWIARSGGGPQEIKTTGFPDLWTKLLLLAAAVLLLALISAIFFTRRKALRRGLPFWDMTARRLVGTMLIPLASGGLIILALLQYGEWRFAVPLSLVFYGIALVSGSRYTLREVGYLGLLQITLGLAATQFPREGLYFWAGGFGALHIVYGLMMWWKYDRVENQS